MTAVAGSVTAGHPAPVLPSAGAPGPGQVPRLADGVELLGEYKGSGYSQPPSLVRRADGQVIQMSALLYRVACRIDGSRDPEAIAGLASARPGPVPDRRPGPLSDHRQTAAPGHHCRRRCPGRRADGQPAARAASAGHAAVQARGERRRGAAGTAVPVACRGSRGGQRRGRGLVAVCRARAGRGGRQVLRDPADMLVVIGLSLVSAVFHEFGHAAGCRYGGARTGVMPCCPPAPTRTPRPARRARPRCTWRSRRPARAEPPEPATSSSRSSGCSSPPAQQWPTWIAAA